LLSLKNVSATKICDFFNQGWQVSMDFLALFFCMQPQAKWPPWQAGQGSFECLTLALQVLPKAQGMMIHLEQAKE
jgi:hypothetical protein